MRGVGGRGQAQGEEEGGWLVLLMYTWPVNLEYDPESQTPALYIWMTGLKNLELITFFMTK